MRAFADLTPEELAEFDLRDQDAITVCAACKTASCWLYEFTIAEARKLNEEHPDTWVKLRDAEGCMGLD